MNTIEQRVQQVYQHQKERHDIPLNNGGLIVLL